MNKNLKNLVFKAVALAMGVATLVLNIITAFDSKSSIILLSIGLTCLAISELEDKK